MAHVVIQVRFYEAVYTSASRSTAKTASPFSYQAYLVKQPKPPSCFRPIINTESKNVRNFLADTQKNHNQKIQVTCHFILSKNITWTFVSAAIWVIENLTKHSSNTLLRLVRFSATHTLETFWQQNL